MRHALLLVSAAMTPRGMIRLLALLVPLSFASHIEAQEASASSEDYERLIVEAVSEYQFGNCDADLLRFLPADCPAHAHCVPNQPSTCACDESFRTTEKAAASCARSKPPR